VSPGLGENIGDIENLNFECRILDDGSIAYVVPAPQPASENTNENWKTEDKSQASTISPYRENPMATSIFGVFYCMKWQLIYAFKKQPKDLPVSIINNASRNGIIPDPNRPLYAASKAFIIALTRSLSNQSAQKVVKTGRAKVRINVIAPGPVDTPMERSAFSGNDFEKKAMAGVPMQRVATPEEIAPAVLFLGDNEASGYITGAILPIDGGDVASPYIPPLK
jgi:NAD(P)-dependent dehydrogenase (short-subunit alcohol dehydrogenase family)